MIEKHFFQNHDALTLVVPMDWLKIAGIEVHRYLNLCLGTGYYSTLHSTTGPNFHQDAPLLFFENKSCHLVLHSDGFAVLLQDIKWDVQPSIFRSFQPISARLQKE